MKALMIMSGSGPILVLSSHGSNDAVLLGKLHHKGIDKFIAYELPWEEVEARYGGHFQTVLNDLHETDDLRVLDVNGQRVFSLFRLDQLGAPIVHDPAGERSQVFMD